jgi:hypothetical protein
MRYDPTKFSVKGQPVDLMTYEELQQSLCGSLKCIVGLREQLARKSRLDIAFERVFDAEAGERRTSAG